MSRRSKTTTLSISTTGFNKIDWSEVDDDEATAEGRINSMQINQIRKELPSVPISERAAETAEKLPENGPFKARFSNFFYECQNEDVTKFFQPIILKSFHLALDSGTQNNRGYGFVEFHSREDLAKGLHMNNKEYKKRPVRVEIFHDGEDQRSRGPGNQTWGSKNTRPGYFQNNFGASRVPEEGRSWRRDPQENLNSDRQEVKPNFQRTQMQQQTSQYQNKFDGQRNNFQRSTSEMTSYQRTDNISMNNATQNVDISSRSMSNQPMEREKIVLEKPSPNSVPVEPVRPKHIFGDAKPVDTASKELALEKKLEQDKARMIEEQKLAASQIGYIPPNNLRSVCNEAFESDSHSSIGGRFSDASRSHKLSSSSSTHADNHVVFENTAVDVANRQNYLKSEGSIRKPYSSKTSEIQPYSTTPFSGSTSNNNFKSTGPQSSAGQPKMPNAWFSGRGIHPTSSANSDQIPGHSLDSNSIKTSVVRHNYQTPLEQPPAQPSPHQHSDLTAMRTQPPPQAAVLSVPLQYSIAVSDVRQKTVSGPIKEPLPVPPLASVQRSWSNVVGSHLQPTAQPPPAQHIQPVPMKSATLPSQTLLSTATTAAPIDVEPTFKSTCPPPGYGLVGGVNSAHLGERSAIGNHPSGNRFNGVQKSQDLSAPANKPGEASRQSPAAPSTIVSVVSLQELDENGHPLGPSVENRSSRSGYSALPATSTVSLGGGSGYRNNGRVFNNRPYSGSQSNYRQANMESTGSFRGRGGFSAKNDYQSGYQPAQTAAPGSHPRLSSGQGPIVAGSHNSWNEAGGGGGASFGRRRPYRGAGFNTSRGGAFNYCGHNYQHAVGDNRQAGYQNSRNGNRGAPNHRYQGGGNSAPYRPGVCEEGDISENATEAGDAGSEYFYDAEDCVGSQPNSRSGRPLSQSLEKQIKILQRPSSAASANIQQQHQNQTESQEGINSTTAISSMQEDFSDLADILPPASAPSPSSLPLCQDSSSANQPPTIVD